MLGIIFDIFVFTFAFLIFVVGPFAAWHEGKEEKKRKHQAFLKARKEKEEQEYEEEREKYRRELEIEYYEQKLKKGE